MTRHTSFTAALRATLLLVAWTSGAQELPEDEVSRDETALMSPTPAQIALWTDRLGYSTWAHHIHAYLSIDRQRDQGLYSQFIYLEHAASGKRRYWQDVGMLSEEPVDTAGRSVARVRSSGVERLSSQPARRIWEGRLSEYGLWRLVAELRAPDATEVVKRTVARFVVSRYIPHQLGPEESEIRNDTLWTPERIRVLTQQVTVHAGATLTIAPGTLVRARGPQAGIVVQPGGRIDASGQAQAPIVMTCDAPIGTRYPGCWAGLTLVGRGLRAGPRDIVDDPAQDSSSVLRYVRVEFAGAGPQGAAFHLLGGGSETILDHIQAHASGRDGIRFTGGAVNCTYCVADGAHGSGLGWSDGWSGTIQHAYLQTPSGADACGIEASGTRMEPDGAGTSTPRLYNVTITNAGYPAAVVDGACAGIRILDGGRMFARNLIVHGFAARSLDFDPFSPAALPAGGVSIDHAILYRAPLAPVGPSIQYSSENPKLVNVRHGASPDPRPMLNSPALWVGAGTIPPQDGILDTSADYVGAFATDNWLEGWTFFGDEAGYSLP